ncbi:Microtubule-associated serine/threonine-protein kinase 3, partial [Operophtera brumata]
VVFGLQVLEMARDCLYKSESKQVTSSYFYDMADSLDRLLAEGITTDIPQYIIHKLGLSRDPLAELNVPPAPPPPPQNASPSKFCHNLMQILSSNLHLKFKRYYVSEFLPQIALGCSQFDPVIRNVNTLQFIQLIHAVSTMAGSHLVLAVWLVLECVEARRARRDGVAGASPFDGAGDSLGLTLL